MSEEKRADVLGAVRCCRREWCDVCPLQSEICDKLCVEMIDVPAELLDMIEQVLEQQN